MLKKIIIIYHVDLKMVSGRGCQWAPEFDMKHLYRTERHIG